MKTAYKSLAKSLRYKGYSLREISDYVGISKSTASLWTSNVELSEAGKYRISENIKIGRAKVATTLHNRKCKRLQDAEISADELLENIKDKQADPIVALAIMYWCEGVKSDNCIAFTNSDPDLACAFINMLVKVFDIDREKLRICVHIHNYHDKDEMLQFWSQKLSVSIKQFTKPYLKKSNHTYSNKDYKGCVRISYYNSHIARVIMAFAKKYIKLYI